MGWCHEFGVTVREGCGHPMRAGETACHCPQCGILCEGQFSGCATVWAAGPREVVLARPAAGTQELVQPPVTNGQVHAERPRQARTAWPVTNAQVKTWSSPSVLLAREPAETVVEVPVAEAPPLVPAAEEMRGQIFEWLQDSFEGLNAQLRVLADNLSRQQQALAEVSDSHAAAGRLSQLADALPERIGAAVQEAVTAGGRSVAAVEHEADTVDLRGSADAERGDQRELPESSPAAAVWSSQVDELVDELVGANVGPPAGAPDSPSPTGVRTQLTSLASTVHTRINRSGWQEKLRSLSSR